jgi:peptidoglycan/xylan/chitin deacetylase (PgdA/CDA1 family)
MGGVPGKRTLIEGLSRAAPIGGPPAGTPAAAAPAAAGPAPKAVGGDVESAKVMRVAWTMDDGPHGKTTESMKRVLGDVPATWFVMRNEIDKDKATILPELKATQDAGGEIAIHSMHATKSHVAWFPAVGRACYPNVDEAIADLASFKAELAGAGIVTKFARLPYGESSEVMFYLQSLHVPDAASVAHYVMLHSAADVSRKYAGTAHAAQVDRVKSDFDRLKAKVAALGLHIWSGTATGAETRLLSWQAESSGAKLTDDVTHHHPAAKVRDPEPAAFEQRCNKVAATGQPGSLIVLAHDTAAVNVGEVGADIAQMNSYAEKKGVRVEYYTVSELYSVLRGAE